MNRKQVGIVFSVCVTVLLCAALVPAVWAQAQNPAATAGKENEWKPEDFVMYESAGGFQISPDGMTLTFRLRRGVRWHDGALFSARDVIQTVPGVGYLFRGAEGGVTREEAQLPR